MDQNKFILSTNRIYVGDIFYKYIEGYENPYIIRIKKCKNSDKFIAKTIGNDITITRKELIENYSRLRNDVYMTFFIVKLEKNAKDVAITIHRKDDLDQGDEIPYSICRQQIMDLFEMQLIREQGINYFGMSVSKDTCPPGANYLDAFSCNGIETGITISCYIGDTLNIILDLLGEKNIKKFDDLLEGIYTAANSNSTIRGLCPSLKSLMEYHDVMYDFLSAFSIIRVPFKIENETLDYDQLTYLESVTKHIMIDYLVIQNDKDIDLDKIEKSHIRVCDEKGDIYIIAYIEGEYKNDYYKKNIKDKRDVVMMLKYRYKNGHADERHNENKVENNDK